MFLIWLWKNVARTRVFHKLWLRHLRSPEVLTFLNSIIRWYFWVPAIRRENEREKYLINRLGPILCDIISRSIAKRWRAANRCSAVSITLSSLLLNTEKTKTAFLNSKKRIFNSEWWRWKKRTAEKIIFRKSMIWKKNLVKERFFYSIRILLCHFGWTKIITGLVIK